MSTTRERVVAFDLLRIFAAVSVVTFHVLAPYMAWRALMQPQALVVALDGCFHYAVRLFTFLAGALSWGVVWITGKGRYRRFVGRRWASVGLPYLFWATAFYLMRPVTGDGVFPHGLRAALGQYWTMLLNGTTAYHLYFIPMVFVLYLLTPLAARAVRLQPEAFLLGVVLVAKYGQAPLERFMHSVRGLYTIQVTLHPLITNVFTYVPFMALGAYYFVRRDALDPLLRKAGWALVVLGGALTTLPGTGILVLEPQAASWLRFFAMVAMVTGFAGIALVVADMKAFRPAAPGADRAVWLASLTLGAYLLHPFVIVFLARRLTLAVGLGVIWTHLAAVLAVTAVVVAASFALVALLKRWGPTSRLVGS